MIVELEEWGIQTERVLRSLRELRKDKSVMRAFEDVMGCELNIEGPDHGIDGMDPNFVPIAFVGNGDYYGLYAYPPRRLVTDGPDPVVQYLHEVPSIEFEAPTVEAWLRQGIKRWKSDSVGKTKVDSALLLEQKLGLGPPHRSARKLTPLESLPTEGVIQRRNSSSLDRWLIECCPPSKDELTSWEREWVAWWLWNDFDVVESDAMIDFGLEAYRALGWKFQEQTLQLSNRVEGVANREDRAIELWCRVHTPSSTPLDPVVQGIVENETRFLKILRHWTRTYSWNESLMRSERQECRRVLGNTLVAAYSSRSLARDRLRGAILDLQYEEGLEGIEKSAENESIREALQQLRANHAQEQQLVASANDWSDIG